MSSLSSYFHLGCRFVWSHIYISNYFCLMKQANFPHIVQLRIVIQRSAFTETGVGPWNKCLKLGLRFWASWAVLSKFGASLFQFGVASLPSAGHPPSGANSRLDVSVKVEEGTINGSGWRYRVSTGRRNVEKLVQPPVASCFVYLISSFRVFLPLSLIYSVNISLWISGGGGVSLWTWRCYVHLKAADRISASLLV